MSLVNCYLLGVLIFCCPAVGKAAIHWDRPELVQKVQDRKILVSAKKIQKEWFFGGIGLIQSRTEAVVDLVMDFQKLSQFDDFFQKVEWNTETQILSLKYSKLGLRGASRVQVWKEQLPASQGYLLRFEIVSGSYKGLTAQLKVNESLCKATEVSFEGHYEGQFLPRFDFLSAFAIEGVLRSVATSMRRKIEGNHVSR
jgi:hypothetical protein